MAPKYPAGLLAVVTNAPGTVYSIRPDGLEKVLEFIENHAEHPKSARELVEFVAKKNYHTVLWQLSAEKRQCLDHPAASRITVELHAYCHRTDPAAEEAPIPIHLYTRHLLNLDASLFVQSEVDKGNLIPDELAST